MPTGPWAPTTQVVFSVAVAMCFFRTNLRPTEALLSDNKLTCLLLSFAVYTCCPQPLPAALIHCLCLLPLPAFTCSWAALSSGDYEDTLD